MVLISKCTGVSIDLCMIFIHGAFQTPQTWLSVVDKMLCNKLDIILIELPLKNMNKDDWFYSEVEDLKIQIQKYKHIVLIGHSLGSVVAVHLLEKFQYFDFFKDLKFSLVLTSLPINIEPWILDLRLIINRYFLGIGKLVGYNKFPFLLRGKFFCDYKKNGIYGLLYDSKLLEKKILELNPIISIFLVWGRFDPVIGFSNNQLRLFKKINNNRAKVFYKIFNYSSHYPYLLESNQFSKWLNSICY